MHSMETLGTKPEDYLAMIQRCLAKKAQQHMENGDVIHSEPIVKEIFDYGMALRVNGRYKKQKAINKETGRLVAMRRKERRKERKRGPF